MTFIIVALLTYIAAGPDPVSLSVTRGAAGASRGAVSGAVRAGNRRAASKAGPIRKAATKAWATATGPGARAAKAGAVRGWYQGVTNARARRAAGTDLIGKSRRAGRATVAASRVATAPGRAGGPGLAGRVAGAARRLGGATGAARAVYRQPLPSTPGRGRRRGASLGGSPGRPVWSPPPAETTGSSGVRAGLGAGSFAVQSPGQWWRDRRDRKGGTGAAGSSSPEATTQTTPTHTTSQATTATGTENTTPAASETSPTTGETAAASTTTDGGTTKETESSDPADPATGDDKTTPTTGNKPKEKTNMAENTQNNMIATTELASLNELKEEMGNATRVFEEMTPLLDALRSWGADLDERWQAQRWGTDDLQAAVGGVSETVGAIASPEGVMEAIASMHEAIAKAEALAEVINDHGGTGRMEDNWTA